MALTPLPVTQIPAMYAGAGTAFVWTAGDAVNHNSFPSSGREILMVQNTSGTPYSHTIKSAPDTPYNRTEDLTEVVPANSFRTYQMFPSSGWASGGIIEVDPANAALEYAVFRVP